jgi:hypothetical protein
MLKALVHLVCIPVVGVVLIVLYLQSEHTGSTVPTIRTYMSCSKDLNDYSTVHNMAYVIKTYASTAPTSRQQTLIIQF